MAGVGKTTVGKELAKLLDYKFVDVDSLIEKNSGLTIQGIIDNNGDKELLRLEQEQIINLDFSMPTIVSPGGSAVYSEKAMAFLKEKTIVVFLDAQFEDIARRVKDISGRGIIGLKQKSFREVFEERIPLYKKFADIIVLRKPGLNAKDTAKEIAKIVKKD